MKRKLRSLGLYMAQGQLSIEDAKSLGIVSYFTYLKTQAECKYASCVFKEKYSDETVDPTSIRQINSLSRAVNEFVTQLMNEVASSKSLITFTELDEYLRFDSPVENHKVLSLSDKLDQIESQVLQCIEQPNNSFSDRISGLQHLIGVQLMERRLGMEIKHLNEWHTVMNVLEGLIINTAKAEVSRMDQSIPDNHSVLYKSAV